MKSFSGKDFFFTKNLLCYIFLFKKEGLATENFRVKTRGCRRLLFVCLREAVKGGQERKGG